jgi:hypothetical protein
MMLAKKATLILQALVQGVDPETGNEIPAASVLQRAQVLRALLAAIDALRQVEQRAQRRSQLPAQVGQRWTADEERALVTAFQAGDALESIAKTLERSVRAIESRLERLGLLTADQRTTTNAFFGTAPARAAADDSGRPKRARAIRAAKGTAD